MSQKSVIRKGDTTSHGGVVLEGIDNYPIMGTPVACKAHMVSCPKCKGTYPIIEGLPYAPVEGRQMAVEGMKTACGAVLIASQSVFTYEWVSGIGSSLSALDNVVDQTKKEYSARFKVTDSESGEVMKNATYYASVNGVAFEGSTDDEGYAEIHASGPNDEIRFHVSFKTPKKTLDKKGE